MKRQTFLQTLAALIMGGPIVASGRIEMPTKKIEKAKSQCAACRKFSERSKGEKWELK